MHNLHLTASQLRAMHLCGKGAGNRCEPERVELGMISIRRRLHSPRRGRDSLWPATAAAALTCGIFAGVSLSMHGLDSWPTFDIVRAREPTAEHVVFVAPRVTPPIIAPPLVARATRSAPTMSPATFVPETAAGRPPLAPDSSSSAAPASATASGKTALPSLSLSLSPRLVPSRPPSSPIWFSTLGRRNPFAPPPPGPPSAAVRDSTLRALGAAVPELAARRVPTTSERDALLREAMLKVQLSKGGLIVPPDHSGGGSISIPLSLFFRGPSRAQREHDRRVFEENRARTERLRLRADSAIRARADSVSKQRAAP